MIRLLYWANAHPAYPSLLLCVLYVIWFRGAFDVHHFLQLMTDIVVGVLGVLSILKIIIRPANDEV